MDSRLPEAGGLPVAVRGTVCEVTHKVTSVPNTRCSTVCFHREEILTQGSELF